MKKTFLISVLLICQLVFSQNSGSANAGMKGYFSKPVLEAYEESAMTKIEDFYQYLEIVSGNLSEEVKAQAKSNISGLFAPGTIVKEFAAYRSALPLTEFMSKMEGRHLNFAVKKVSSQTFTDYWLITYMVTISNGTETTSETVTQKVYFNIQPKKFGDTEKVVWAIQLGTIE